MPKRTDIHSILVIGAGPIVIGQACEFDYSGTQACKALRDEGYRVILVNSNPATIMTDPETADVTYIEPITPAIVAKIIDARAAGRAAADHGRADRAQHGHGAGARRHAGAARRRADRRLARGDRQGRGPRAVPRRRWLRIGLDLPKSRVVRSLEEAREALAEIGLPAIIRPSFTLGGTGGGIAYNREEFEQIVASRPRRLADRRGADRAVGAGLEGVRDGGGPRPRGQLHHRLLDRERRSRWACTPATASPWPRR